MRLNRGERWIFDIGSRRDIQNAPMRPLTHFVTRGPSISCNLQAPAIYTFTLGIYGDNIPSTERRIRVSVGQAAGDIRFPGQFRRCLEPQLVPAQETPPTFTVCQSKMLSFSRCPV